jgi:ferric-dicitrate binding protein FerR (iron transport regulator)
MSEDIKYTWRIAALITAHIRGTLTEEEALELKVWCAQSAANQALFDKLSDPEYVKDNMKDLPDIQASKLANWDTINSRLSTEDSQWHGVPVRRMNWRRYLVAASLVGAAVVGTWLYVRSRQDAGIGAVASAPVASHLKNDVAPGGNKAVLTLSDGSSVVLDKAEKGAIANQGAARVMKVDDGKLAYNITEKPTELAYNTLTTPAAGQFEVLLPDGSKVWLNNASSLRYPVAFAGKDREVELKGEAYFEIAPNSRQPFKVKVDDMLVDVLGTSFNISAYADEGTIKTTLLTGAVRVSKGNRGTLLKPNEQLQLNEMGKLSVLKDVDVDAEVAWKSGLFHFDRADIKTVMRVLARWYDLDVRYEGPVTSHEFGGYIERDLNLSQVLEILQKNQVHFDLEGRRITVRP